MLSSHQYGFRMGLSTTLAICDMQENILENLEKGFITCPIFCDLSKAFDTIDHDVLLWKLKYVLSTMGVSKESISKFLIGNRFHVKLRILSPENCKQSLQVKS